MDLRTMKKVVFEQKPVLKQTIDLRGTLTLEAYARESQSFVPRVDSRLQDEFLQVFHSELSLIFSKEIADEAVRELQNNYYVSTADHHGPLVHPFFLNGLLVQSLTNETKGNKFIFVLPCGGISLNNSSFPRGLVFHSEKLEEERLHFFSLQHRHHPVYGKKAYNRRDFSRLKAELKSAAQQNEISPGLEKKITNILEKIYGTPEQFSFQYFSEQMALSNFHLWKQLPGQENMHLIYLEQESLVRSLILRFHLYQKTVISELLQNPDYHKAFLSLFDGVTGAFSGEEKGTFLFWAIKGGERVPLKLRGKELVNTQKKIKISLQNDDLKAALEKKLLMPSMVLSFIVLGFYYGLSTGGGFSQVNYLTAMKSKWIELLRTVREPIPKHLNTLKTDYFCGEMALTFLQKERNVVAATSLDLILYKNEETAKNIRQLFKKITLGEAVDGMMPEFYKIITGKKVEEISLEIKPCIYV